MCGAKRIIVVMFLSLFWVVFSAFMFMDGIAMAAMMSALMSRCLVGTPEEVASAIRSGADVNEQDERGDTPLHVAARHNINPEVIAVLLNAGADANARDSDGLRPIVYASGRKILTNSDVYGQLKSATGAPSGEFFFELCAIGTPKEIVSAVEFGRDINARGTRSDETPLHFAAGYNSDPEAITVLLKAGADTNARTKYGSTPLHYAASNVNPEVLAVLLKTVADVNVQDERGDTPLHYNVYDNPSPDVIAILLKAGADVNVQNKDGKMPIDVAERNETTKNSDVYRLLKIASGLRLDDEEFLGLCTSGGPEEIASAIKSGANVNARDAKGLTPLHVAAKSNANRLAVAVLLKAGANINALEENGFTPLNLAAGNANPEVAAVLLEARANLNASDEEGSIAATASAPNGRFGPKIKGLQLGPMSVEEFINLMVMVNRDGDMNAGFSFYVGNEEYNTRELFGMRIKDYVFEITGGEENLIAAIGKTSYSLRDVINYFEQEALKYAYANVRSESCVLKKEGNSFRLIEIFVLQRNIMDEGVSTKEFAQAIANEFSIGLDYDYKAEMYKTTNDAARGWRLEVGWGRVKVTEVKKASFN
jgi:ankyrin repeat protein